MVLQRKRRIAIGCEVLNLLTKYTVECGQKRMTMCKNAGQKARRSCVLFLILDQ